MKPHKLNCNFKMLDYSCIIDLTLEIKLQFSKRQIISAKAHEIKNYVAVN